MKPSEIHSLPSIRMEGLLDVPFEPDLAYELFGFECMNLAGPASSIELHVKAEHQHLGIDTILRSVIFQGSPFAIHVQAGHEAANSSAFVTDSDVFAHATAYVRGLIKKDGSRPLIDATFDLPLDLRKVLDGSALARFGDDIRMMDGFLVAENGLPLIDPDAWRVSCRDGLIPGIKALGGGTTFRDDRVRELAMSAFRDAQRPEVEYLEVFDFESDQPSAHWVAYVVVTDEGSYKVGVAGRMIDCPGWPWVHDLGGQRIGGPELADRYRGSSLGYR